MIKKVFAIILMCNIHYIDFGINSWYVMQFGYMCCILFLCWIVFDLIPQNRINERYILALFIIYSFYDIATYWLWVFNIDYGPFAGIILTMFFYVRLTCIEKRNNWYYNDTINENNYFICFEHPFKKRGIFISLIGLPVSSIAVYRQGYLYSFKWKTKKYSKYEISKEKLSEKYVVVDTGVKISEKNDSELEKLLGKTTGLRIKCVYIIKDFLRGLNSKYSPKGIEYVPAIYAKKLLRVKYEKLG